MATKNEINQLLKREIKDGEQYSHLIDKPTGARQKLENGDTVYSTKIMKKWAETFYKQVAKLSNFLKGKTLQQTCNNIHGFMYNYIQYETDKVMQNLRSPANSWHVERKNGIDCKSFSIFASSVLLNLGIKHYIRQIKQPGFNSKQFTHVYIVVPIDQVTENLDKGYHTIDGTIKTTKEPIFSQKKDLYMLPHLGLNGAKTKKKATITKKAKTKKTSTKTRKGLGLIFLK